jgi:hypothetical protein
MSRCRGWDEIDWALSNAALARKQLPGREFVAPVLSCLGNLALQAPPRRLS